MILAHRIRLDLNNVQATWLERCAGAARFTFNWGLARWQEQYAEGKKPSWQTLNVELNQIKAAEFPWMTNLPWAVTSKALADLGTAFTGFFHRVKMNDRKPGYPRFKSKKRGTPSFYIEGRALSFDGKRIKFPKFGWLRMREALRFPGKVISARFTKRAGHWYVSLQVEVADSYVYPHRCETQAVVGVDLGVVDLAVFSTGERIEAPRALREHEQRLCMLQKRLSRRIRGGKNWQKTKAQIQKLYEHITNIRRDVTHKLTASLVQRFRWIGVENLNIAGMSRTRLAKSVMDAAMAEVGRQLGYKTLLAGSVLVVADRFYPSSKKCSICGVVYTDLALGERRWICDSCGTEHDRDENAAKNLEMLAAAQAVTACCHGSSDVGPEIDVKLPLGQESSSVVDLG